jgi:O-methyltransferase involved in polyketide biosynthesis
MSDRKVKTQLTDVPETMLWTLHNRASEAMRDDGIIDVTNARAASRGWDYPYARDTMLGFRLLFDTGVEG